MSLGYLCFFVTYLQDLALFCGRYVFPCRQWVPLSADKNDAVRLECKSSEKPRMAAIRGMTVRMSELHKGIIYQFSNSRLNEGNRCSKYVRLSCVIVRRKIAFRKTMLLVTMVTLYFDIRDCI